MPINPGEGVAWLRMTGTVAAGAPNVIEDVNFAPTLVIGSSDQQWSLPVIEPDGTIVNSPPFTLPGMKDFNTGAVWQNQAALLMGYIANIWFNAMGRWIPAFPQTPFGGYDEIVGGK